MPIGFLAPTRRTVTVLALALVSIAAFAMPASAQRLNCNLIARLDSLPGNGSSCWGYIDPNTSVEYAILGNQNGTAIWNIATPSEPQMTGFIPGPSSTWREMKTYAGYIYVGTEAGGGMQIIDIQDPEAPFLAATYTGAGLSSIHSVTVDTLNAKLYLNGSNPNNSMRILSLANPVAPVQVGNYTAEYVHDSHVRDDTLYAACFYAGQVRVLNVSNPAAITQIVAINSPMSSTHNCWTTEDRQYLLITDETTGGRVSSWDISTLTSPIQVDDFTADPLGDAHNVQITNNLAYVAHYTSGLQVLDVTDPTNLVRVGFYDTYPGGAAGGVYNGAWGVYNDFPSGMILISDMQSGLFLIDYVENPSYVRGNVTDANTLLPIPNAIVKVVEANVSDSTDAAGVYIALADAGSYTLAASAFGYFPDTALVSTTLGDTSIVNIALTPLPTGSVSGTFKTGGGTGISNAIVRIENTPYVDTTDVAGAFNFPNVLVGTYEIGVAHWTSIPDSEEIEVVTGFANTSVDFVFDPVFFAHNFEDTSTAGWSVNAQGGDNATAGIWVRVDPRGTNGGTVQPEDDHTRNPLLKCYVTGQGPVGGDIGAQDVDNGRTTLYSPNIDLSTLADPIIQYFRWYVNDANGTVDDVWKAQISSNGGTTWVTTDSTGTTTAAWIEIKVRVADYVTPSTQVRMRFIADDSGSGSIVEAGIDDFRVWNAFDPLTPVSGSGGGSRFALLPNAPNPFNPRTEVRFELAHDGVAKLSIFSLEGRLVRTLVKGALPAGRHAVPWDGRDNSGGSVASGVYVMRLEAGKETAARKIVLAK